MKDILNRAVWSVKERTPERWPGRLRARWLLCRLRLAAVWHRASVDIDVAPDLWVGRHVRVEIEPFTANRLRWGRRGRIGTGSVIRLTGGHLDSGDDVQIRDRCVLNVGGHLVFEGRNILSWAVSVHCAESVHVGERTGITEFATVVDSAHRYTGEDEWMAEHIETRPVRIGVNCWICAKAVVARGAVIGDHCIVSANTLVTGTVPDCHLASGVPAGPPVPLPHPWLERG